ncbi:hypothetical protein VK055_5098 [Klebsiella pneumoniae subsp. pneumoniae]|nr:hypothetical protein VK055_5098 [Klebsiella pneumoniae subsp. pneumoniae]
MIFFVYLSMFCASGIFFLFFFYLTHMNKNNKLIYKTEIKK